MQTRGLWSTMERKLAGMTAVILAGGLGTRLRPVVSNCAKVLADIDGQPFIRFILDHLSASGVKSVVL
ncbi:MAG: NTP transferase domain-containing protein, partial [Proteobacteria bacterium]|nr:NTP transferase domain-containing protein [Pseudomonadota bacterium]